VNDPIWAASWSGGKDSCLALQLAIESGGEPYALLTVLDEHGERSRSHGLRPEVLHAQARACGLPMREAWASWQTYEEAFVAALRALRDEGVTDCVFGDIDLEDHRIWEQRVCERAGLRASLPLWQRDRREVLDEHWRRGFRCHVVAVDARKLDRDVLGAELTPELATRFERDGVDACGENGEFHTVAVDGPLFQRPLELAFGEIVERSGYLAIDARPRG
jgi:uncharacterized protein (TIGR00290 family)